MRLRRELDYLMSALMFYTCLPCPSWVAHSDEILNRSRKYFPLVGWIVGGLAAVAYLAANTVLPPAVAILLSMAATICATGAFHEDGWADACDAFGGGWSKPQILAIMKDSRIGTYGTVGIVMLLAVKFSALLELQRMSGALMLITLVNGHVLSRFAASAAAQTMDYVQDVDASKIKPVADRRLGGGEMLFSALTAIAPMLLYSPLWLPAVAVIPVIMIRWYLTAYFNRRIGGYTGDCLGAIQQICETVFYLSVLSLCSFI